jgi:hypothetical protein
MIEKYIKTPVVVEVLQWTGENSIEIEDFCFFSFINTLIDGSKKLTLASIEGNIYPEIGDYIIKDSTGEFCICKQVVFEDSYNIYLDKTMSSSCSDDGCRTI